MISGSMDLSCHFLLNSSHILLFLVHQYITWFNFGEKRWVLLITLFFSCELIWICLVWSKKLGFLIEKFGGWSMDLSCHFSTEIHLIIYLAIFLLNSSHNISHNISVLVISFITLFFSYELIWVCLVISKKLGFLIEEFGGWICSQFSWIWIGF
jgi:hypothetical protein